MSRVVTCNGYTDFNDDICMCGLTKITHSVRKKTGFQTDWLDLKYRRQDEVISESYWGLPGAWNRRRVRRARAWCCASWGSGPPRRGTTSQGCAWRRSLRRPGTPHPATHIMDCHSVKIALGLMDLRVESVYAHRHHHHDFSRNNVGHRHIRSNPQ